MGGLLLDGCGSGPSHDWPFGDGGSSWTLCYGVRGGGVATDGFSSFRNSGSSVATIDRVVLEDAVDLRLVGALVVPVTGTTLIGDLTNFPPSASEIPSGAEWGARQEAVGAHIPPYRASLRTTDTENLLVGVASVAGKRTGTAAAVDVYYQEGNAKYVLRLPTELTVRVAPEHC